MPGGTLTFPVKVPRKALVCALDWGLGHVARTTPLVRSLLEAGTSVTLASNGRSAAWWRAEFPDLEVRALPDYGVAYTPGWRLVPGLLASLPRIARAIRSERGLVDAWVRAEGHDLVLSDNRYGCRADGATSVLLTHQLRLAAPRGLGWCEGFGEAAIARMVRGFDSVWIPDRVDGIRLSGKLGHPRDPRRFPPLRHIGPLSRFSGIDPDPAWAGPWDTVALVSGPEPTRTTFEDLLRHFLSQRAGRHLLVRGRPDLGPSGGGSASSDLVEVPHLPSPALAAALGGAREIVCRGGYSTVMDLEALGVLDPRCLLVPTPGQTEQEYLAEYLAAQGSARTASEADLS